jgi:hypothetical protein
VILPAPPPAGLFYGLELGRIAGISFDPMRNCFRFFFGIGLVSPVLACDLSSTVTLCEFRRILLGADWIFCPKCFWSGNRQRQRNHFG